MRTNDYYNLGGNRSSAHYFLKMAKHRTVTFMMMIISTCALLVTLTNSYPVEETATAETNKTHVQLPRNISNLVITHLVKTIEFEVGVLEDDGSGDDNSSEQTSTQYIQTDIKLLNVDLLKEILDQASKSDEASSTVRIEKREVENNETNEPFTEQDLSGTTEGSHEKRDTVKVELDQEGMRPETPKKQDSDETSEKSLEKRDLVEDGAEEEQDSKDVKPELPEKRDDMTEEETDEEYE